MVQFFFESNAILKGPPKFGWLIVIYNVNFTYMIDEIMASVKGCSSPGREVNGHMNYIDCQNSMDLSEFSDSIGTKICKPNLT